MLTTHLLSFIRDWQFHQPEAQQVVHVHALGPAFLVTNFGLVLQVTHNLGLARQGPKLTDQISVEHIFCSYSYFFPVLKPTNFSFAYY